MGQRPVGMGVVLPDGALVCRGGTCVAKRFVEGSGVVLGEDGLLRGVSVNSASDRNLEELTAMIPNRQVGVTTVGAIRRLGGDAVPSPTPYNPFHATLDGITSSQAEGLFTPTTSNPNR